MATTFKKQTNNAAGSLSAGIDDNDLSFTLEAGEGAEFPSSGAFWVTLYDTDPAEGEVVLCDSRSSDAFTVNASGRGAQGTSATSWPSGTNVALLLTAGAMDEIQAAINAIENGGTTLSSVSASGNVSAQGGYGSTGTTIGDHVQTNGNLRADGFFALGRAAGVSISAGAITPVASSMRIDTEGAAGTDDLDTIADPGIDGAVLILRTVSGSRDVTIRHLGGGTGNIRLMNSTNFTLANTSTRAILEWDGITSLWCCWTVSLN